MVLKSPTLGYIDFEDLKMNPLNLWVDWSTTATSCVLTQNQDLDKKELKDRSAEDIKNNVTSKVRLLCCIGRKNPPSFANLSSPLGEASAIILATDKLRPLLLAASLHLAFGLLDFLANLKDLKNQFYRLYTQLGEHQFWLLHTSGKVNI